MTNIVRKIIYFSIAIICISSCGNRDDRCLSGDAKQIPGIWTLTYEEYHHNLDLGTEVLTHTDSGTASMEADGSGQIYIENELSNVTYFFYDKHPGMSIIFLDTENKANRLRSRYYLIESMTADKITLSNTLRYNTIDNESLAVIYKYTFQK
ncbi:MAG: hypothetical protein AAFV95_04875 [Bacteroidota bacterium]